MSVDVKQITFAGDSKNGHVTARATVTMRDGKQGHFADQDAITALLTFLLTDCVPQLDDPVDVLRSIPLATGKPLPSWVVLP